MKTRTICFLFSPILIWGCLNIEETPPQPSIEFISLTETSPQATLTVSFVDGDGDFGLDDSDNQPPFDTSSIYYYNLFLDYYAKTDGVWENKNETLEAPFYYRINRLEPTGQSPVLRGKIDVALTNYFPPSGIYDPIRFEVKIVDRSLNESNSITTPELID